MPAEQDNPGLGINWPDKYSELYKTRALCMNELINTVSVRIYDMGAIWLKTPEWSGQHTLDPYCRIFYVENGTAWVECNHQRYDLNPGQFYFFPAWMQMYFPENHDTFLYHLHCRINVLSGVDIWHIFTPRPMILANPPEDIREQFKQFAVNPPAEPTSQFHLLTLTYQLISLFLQTDGFTLAEHSNLAVERISRVLKVMDEKSKKVYRTSELARICNLSRSRFSSEFKMITGMSPARFQMVRRLALIQRLLVNTDTKLEALAYDFGFSSPYHLSNTFKRYLGISPLEFRKKGRP